MSEKQTNLSYGELQELLKVTIGETVKSAVAEVTKLNPIEQKQLNDEVEKERRRRVLAVELGYADELKKWNAQHSCTHSRDEKSGASVPTGRGTYTTGGQIHGDGSVVLMCLRCQTEWKFMPTREEADFILNGPGLLGYAPPPIERCLNKSDFLMKPPVKPEVAYQ